ncbi:hypothetical protein L596_007492 [Steinernema carpocapsae]|uniref:EGF-like domain-containing protein n=1 Tax=Steinernema carpocapsae TaxID=34508 RepID=A0A4U5P9G5_STECR|nr:hypothetical protein L596_007492 [Steinernema carpocapsae]
MASKTSEDEAELPGPIEAPRVLVAPAASEVPVKHPKATVFERPTFNSTDLRNVAVPNATIIAGQEPNKPGNSTATEKNSENEANLDKYRKLILEAKKNQTIHEKSEPKAPPKTEEKSDNGILSGVNGMVNSVVENFKKMLGYGPECLNGGTRNSAGDCMCPKFYSGSQCQNISCTNAGVPVKLKKKPQKYVEWECECPNPDFISGKHCELIKCLNGGRPIANTGKCECNETWYQGDFCQNYTSHWFTFFGIPLFLVVIVVLCCIVCRLDFCPRRSTQEARRRRRNHAMATSSGRPRERRTHHDRQQQNLLHANRNHREMVPYRLETIPVFNPRLLDDDLPKITEAPPSYEQALAMSTPAALIPDRQPPSYTPAPSGIHRSPGVPPPPACRPPPVPHSSSSR